MRFGVGKSTNHSHTAGAGALHITDGVIKRQKDVELLKLHVKASAKRTQIGHKLCLSLPHPSHPRGTRETLGKGLLMLGERIKGAVYFVFQVCWL